MAGTNINRVILTGNLTKDPELRSLPSSGTAVCSLRVACNGRRKNNETGQWEDQPNFFDVTVCGPLAETCAAHLAKGRLVGVSARLEPTSWETPDGAKRRGMEVIAGTVEFLDRPRRDGDSTEQQSQDVAVAA